MLTSRRVAMFVGTTIALMTVAAAQINVGDVGPRVGAAVPPFIGVDQFGRTQTLQSVLGPDGAMLVFFRSADW